MSAAHDQRVILKSRRQEFSWVDFASPTEEEMETITRDYSLPFAWMHDCKDPSHLPKYEESSGQNFLLVRIFDSQKGPNADTIEEMTNSIGLVMGPNFLLTIHSCDPSFLRHTEVEWIKKSDYQQTNGITILLDLLKDVVVSYQSPLEETERLLDKYESQIFKSTEVPRILQQLYFLKRKISSFRKLIRMHIEVFQKMHFISVSHLPALQDLREKTDSLSFFTDKLTEDINNLLNLQLAMASFRTNEVMRLLTSSTIIFMPLTFIAGVYGMNFEFMPELKSKHGYFVIWGIMIGVAVGIYLWLRKKGWTRL